MKRVTFSEEVFDRFTTQLSLCFGCDKEFILDILEKSRSQCRKPNNYLIFMKLERPRIQKEFPNISFGDIAKECGKRWSKMTIEEKTAYITTNADQETEKTNTLFERNEKFPEEKKDVVVMIEKKTADNENFVVSLDPRSEHNKKLHYKKIHALLMEKDERDFKEDPHKKEINQKIREKYKDDEFFHEWMEKKTFKYLCYTLRNTTDYPELIPNDLESLSKEEVLDLFIIDNERPPKPIKVDLYAPVDYLEDHPAYRTHLHLEKDQLIAFIEKKYPEVTLQNNEDKEQLLMILVNQYDYEKNYARSMPLVVNPMYHEMKRKKTLERIEIMKQSFPHYDIDWSNMTDDELIRFSVDHAAQIEF